MLFEELFNERPQEDKDVIHHFYIATLSAWLIYNDLNIFDNLLKHFEEKEEYLICEAVHRAIDKIDEVYNDRFDQATRLHEDEDVIQFSFDEHKRVSRLIFEDIVKEIYEKQISQHKESDRGSDWTQD